MLNIHIKNNKKQDHNINKEIKIKRKNNVPELDNLYSTSSLKLYLIKENI